MKLRRLALLQIFLVVSIPFYIADVYAAEQNATSVNQATGQVVITPNPPDITGAPIPESGQQCINKYKKTSGLADILDNGVISTIETIVSTMNMICTVMTAIDFVLSIVSNIIGFKSEKDNCCLLGYYSGGTLCTAMEKVYTAWATIYHNPVVEGLCCLITCGWCTGKGCTGIAGDLPLVGGQSGRGENAKAYQSSPSLSKTVGIDNSVGGGYGALGVAQFHLNPFENIYVATYCMCPTAILFNLRKLKTIYQVYNCCIEQACTNGLSTEPCQQQLDEATCMYWKGSLLKTVVKILMSVLANFLADQLGKLVSDKLTGMNKCVLKLVQAVTNIPAMLSQLSEAWNWMSVSFSEPKCTNLGFDKIKKELSGRPVPYSYYGLVDTGNGLYTAIFGPSSQSGQTSSTWLQSNEAIFIKSSKQSVEILGNANPDTGNFNVKITNTETGVSSIKEMQYLEAQQYVAQFDKDYYNAKTAGNGATSQDVNNAMSSATWALLDYTLGSYAYGAIDDMCKKDYTSSEPQKK